MLPRHLTKKKKLWGKQFRPRTPDYTLCSGVHVCWSEHSDSSFVYGFMILNYGFGTMTATTICYRPSLYEPAHDKTYSKTCATSKDSHQPVHLPSMVRVVVIHLIKKTCLYNFDSLKPHFYIVKLGFIGVHIIFLNSAQNIDCGYSLEPPRWGGSNKYLPTIYILIRNMRNIRLFYRKIFSFCWYNFQYIWIGVFL